ncbi:MAG: nucleotide sugar dehydrogenase [Phycisphaerae bacterium]|nr:nucleotide sugar dehydrogenase [Phycisphaerae bacterium]
MNAYETLKSKLQNGTALVGVIGLGYVGLPLAHALHQGGLPVLGFDIDPEKIDALAKGVNYLKHLGDDMVRDLAGSERFRATVDFSRLGECDAVLVCVPTPLGKHLEPDMSYVVAAGNAIGRCIRAGQLLVLESTTYPRTTREDFLEAILNADPARSRGLLQGRDIFVAFSPEREDPGRKSHSTSTIPKLVGGLEEQATELATMMYRRGIKQVIPVSSAEVAESAKLLENIFRAVNIALVNEMKTILEPMGIDVWEVIQAAATKPFGFMPFYPGPGLGGHCIPIDPFYLSWKAREFGKQAKFIELAGEINSRMPHYVVDQTARALNAEGKATRGANLLVVGLAYKPDVDDTRETPAAEIITLLSELGAKVAYHDPHVPEFPRMRKYDFDMHSVALSPETLARFDAVVIVTDHAVIDYKAIGQHARLIIDTRNAMSKAGPCRAKVVKS